MYAAAHNYIFDHMHCTEPGNFIKYSQYRVEISILNYFIVYTDLPNASKRDSIYNIDMLF